MDYKDFVVLLGLDTKASGRWVYQKRNDKKTDLSKFAKLAQRWRACLPKSKWCVLFVACVRAREFVYVHACGRVCARVLCVCTRVCAYWHACVGLCQQ